MARCEGRCWSEGQVRGGNNKCPDAGVQSEGQIRGGPGKRLPTCGSPHMRCTRHAPDTLARERQDLISDLLYVNF